MEMEKGTEYFKKVFGINLRISTAGEITDRLSNGEMTPKFWIQADELENLFNKSIRVFGFKGLNGNFNFLSTEYDKATHKALIICLEEMKPFSQSKTYTKYQSEFTSVAIPIELKGKPFKVTFEEVR